MSESEQQRPSVSQQASFGEDGSLETSDDPVETSLDDWGMDIDHQQRETRIDQPEASLTADTRPGQGSIDAGEQEELFHETSNGQMDLTGDAAERFCFMFGEDTQNGAE
jgi:hypothetical protein